MRDVQSRCKLDLQESTFYREGDSFAPKEFSLKLQGVKGRKSNEKPQTFAKMELDMASYCNCLTPGSRDLIVELRWGPIVHAFRPTHADIPVCATCQALVGLRQRRYDALLASQVDGCLQA